MTERPAELATPMGDGEPFTDGPVVVFIWRNESGWPVEYVSPNVERLFGYTPAELYDADPPYAELVHDDDLWRVIEEVERHSDPTTDRFHHEPYRMVTKGGAVRWVLDYTRILREDGEIVGYTGYIVDITERKTQLEYVNALNATIRSLHRVLIDADSRTEINEGVCEALAELDGFAGAWIGTVDFPSEGIVPAARSGIEASYLDTISLSPDADVPALAARVALGGVTDGEHRVPHPEGEAAWHSAALSRGYRSVFTVPIRHRELVHGALSVYGTEPDTFDPRIREILLELGTLVGYAITAVERRNALYGDGSRELVLEVAIEDDDPLRTLARRLSSPVEVRSVSRRKGDTRRLYCLISDPDPDTALAAAERVPEIESIEALSDGASPIYGLVTRGTCNASKTTVLGAGFRSMTVSERSCELVVSVRRSRDRRRFLGQARELFGEAELKAERDAAPSERMPWEALLAGTLTDRQRDVLKAAYHAGYFDGNRKRTGGEIADSLGIAQPTFSRHLRAAQRNLLSAIWDGPDVG
jgi:PAS domain S-box-containing protein